MNVMLVGGESAGLQTLKTLVGSGHQVCGVLKSPARNGFPDSGISTLARKLNVPTWPAHRIRERDFAAVVRDLKVDLLLNVHSLYVFPVAVLDSPRFGCFNLHPGPLPECAGLNAPSWALWQGAPTHGVSLHWMVPGIDEGPLAFSERFPIEDTDTGLSLSLKCIRAGMRLVEHLLQAAATDVCCIPRIPQNLDNRHYFGAGPPDDGRLSWTSSAQEVFDFVRAADYRPFRSPWRPPRTVACGREFGIVSTRRTGRPTSDPPGAIGDTTDEGVEVACRDEWLLVREVETEGRCQRAAAAFASIDRLA